MMYESTNQRREDIADFLGNETAAFRMAKVVQVVSGRPVLRFNGETEDAKKKYKYLSSYTPASGDYVILARIASTYIILGKVV